MRSQFVMFLFSMIILSNDFGCLPPTVDMSEQTVILTEDKHSLTCPVDAFSLTNNEIVWFVDGKQINFETDIYYSIDGRNILFKIYPNLIRPLQFKCLVRNPCGREMSLPIDVFSVQKDNKVNATNRPYGVITNNNKNGKCMWLRIPYSGGVTTVIEDMSANRNHGTFPLSSRLVAVENNLYFKYFIANDSTCNYICIKPNDLIKFKLSGINENFQNSELVPVFPRGRDVKLHLNTSLVFSPCLFLGGDYDQIVYERDHQFVSFDFLEIKSEETYGRYSYSCTPVRNKKPLIEHRQNFTVSFYDQPVISDKLRSVNASSGDHVSFECKIARGKPEPKIEWFINSKKLDKSENPLISTNGDFLNISNANESMSVKCRASNAFGTHAKSVYLKITRNPEIYVNGGEVIISQSHLSEVKCKGKVDSLRSLDITWMYNGKPVEANSMFQVTQNGDISSFIWTLSNKNYQEMDGVVDTLKCVVSDGYATAEKVISVKYEIGVTYMRKVFLWKIMWVPVVLLIIFIISIIAAYVYRTKTHGSYTLLANKDSPRSLNQSKYPGSSFYYPHSTVNSLYSLNTSAEEDSLLKCDY